MLSRAIYKKQRGRRPLAALAIMSIVAGLLISSATVLAVHDEDFELDGNVSVEAGGPAFDWASFFDTAGAELALPANFTASGFDRDFVTNTNGTYNTADASTFATGSKDTLNITPGWQCGYSANVNSKTDISNAYAAEYVDPVTGDEILYFGLERNANTGDGNVGFWFLQDGTVACEATATSGNVAFTGNHVDGDLLVVSEFSNGGAISTIQAYEWVGGAGGAIDPDPIASGASCATASGGDAICARVNTGTISTPWLTANKQDGAGHSLRVSEFFEAGLNLTDSGFGGSCFSTFTGVTRSSTSLTATIFDYSLGTLGDCDSSTVTQAKDGSGANLTSATIPATGTLSVKDTATVTVDGVNTFDATVTFYLCGPSTTLISTCSTSGLQIGSPVAIAANGSVDSATAQLTSAGYYCWHAVFSGDGDIPGSADDGTNECFVVNPRQPTLATQATTGPVNFGSSISDTVTLSNTANKPGSGTTIDVARGGVATGNITLTAYGPDSCSTVAHGPVTLAANGNNPVGGVGTTFEFTPTAPGEYVFVASYAGDSPNTLGVAADTCASQPSNEKVTVRTIPTSISSTQSVYPNDSATIGSTVGNLAAGGTVQFRLFNSLANCTNGAAQQTVGQGGLLYKQSFTPVGGAATEAFSTTNTGTAVSANSTIAWRVTYTPAAGDTAHTGRQSACTETTALAFTNDAGPGTLFP